MFQIVFPTDEMVKKGIYENQMENCWDVSIRNILLLLELDSDYTLPGCNLQMK